MLHPCWCRSSWILRSIFCNPSRFQSIPQICPSFLKDLTLSSFISKCACTLNIRIFLRWLTFGFFLEKTSLGVLFLSTLCGVRFYTYTAVLAASAHICIGRSWSWSMALAASMIILFFLSAIPFCCVYGVDNSLLIPESLHNSLNSFDVNSLPLFDRKVLIFF